jgi:hypothetical protein
MLAGSAIAFWPDPEKPWAENREALNAPRPTLFKNSLLGICFMAAICFFSGGFLFSARSRGFIHRLSIIGLCKINVL